MCVDQKEQTRFPPPSAHKLCSCLSARLPALQRLSSEGLATIWEAESHIPAPEIPCGDTGSCRGAGPPVCTLRAGGPRLKHPSAPLRSPPRLLPGRMALAVPLGSAGRGSELGSCLLSTYSPGLTKWIRLEPDCMAGSWGPAFRSEETPVKRDFHSSQKTHRREFVPLAGAGGAEITDTSGSQARSRGARGPWGDAVLRQPRLDSG